MLLSSAAPWPVKSLSLSPQNHQMEDNQASFHVHKREEKKIGLNMIFSALLLASLLNLSLLIFLLLAVTLIAFAGRLSNRIRHLEILTDKAIDKQGRVQEHIPDVRRGDELDDLNNHIRDMLIRLRAYHDYLEKLASRLSHEIRTPVAVVRSSLENMQHQLALTDDQKMNDNLGRANEGISRLQTLLHRMAEATRLEQSIHESSKDKLNVGEFLEQIVAGYEDIYPTHQFNSQSEVTDVNASGDLLAQALDKLVSNAVSFAEHDTTVTLSAYDETDYWCLCVTNVGPNLPEGMEQQLFQSMVSIRDKSAKDGQPHLGLGLHIVQLIAEYHDGQAIAENTPSE